MKKTIGEYLKTPVWGDQLRQIYKHVLGNPLSSVDMAAIGYIYSYNEVNLK